MYDLVRYRRSSRSCRSCRIIGLIVIIGITRAFIVAGTIVVFGNGSFTIVGPHKYLRTDGD